MKKYNNIAFIARGKVPLMDIKGKTFKALFLEREERYEKYADITVVRNINRENDVLAIVAEIIGVLH